MHKSNYTHSTFGGVIAMRIVSLVVIFMMTFSSFAPLAFASYEGENDSTSSSYSHENDDSYNTSQHSESDSDESISHGDSDSNSSDHEDKNDNTENDSDSHNKNDKDHKITICHATHSDSNPYVKITVSHSAYSAHDSHQDDEDVMADKDGNCPKGNHDGDHGDDNHGDDHDDHHDDGDEHHSTNHAPVITLIGDSNVTILVGTSYVDPGATALDHEDGNITSSIIASSTVNSNVVGTYTITYNVKDSKGLSATTVTRTVNVIIGEDDNGCDGDNDEDDNGCEEVNLAPDITLIGDSTVTILVGTSYVDPGATALDHEDGNITSSIIASSTVNSNVVGTYTITYNVKDSKGLSATTVTRTVKVVSANTANKGKITFCLVLADDQNAIATSSNGLPAGTFTINLATSTNFASSSVGSKIWNSNTFSPNTKTILGVNDSDCVTFSDLDYGTYSYPELSVSGSLWNTPKYNDQNDQPVNNVFDFFPYSTTTSNSDGVINVDSVRSDRTLVMYVTHMPDTVANHTPVISLVGDSPMTVTVGSLFTDPGATALDQEDGNITSSIIASSTVNSNVVGTYTITYNVKDSKGLSATTVTRVVNVVPAQCLLPEFTSPLAVSVTVNQAFSYSLVASSTLTSEIVYTVATTSLPAGLSYSTTTNTISGTPINIGVTNVEIKASNLCGVTAKTLVITVKDVETVGNGGNGGGSVVNIGGGGGGNGPIVGSYGGQNISSQGSVVTTPAPETVGGSCSYLIDYLRADFNNNPVEVKKLQAFLKNFEGFTNLDINGVYDEATVNAVNSFQVKYKGDVLTPWGHTAPTGYTYILTKKKVNEIYCKFIISLTPEQQAEIEAYRNSGAGANSVSITNPAIGYGGNIQTIVEENVINKASSAPAKTTNSVLTTLAGLSSLTQGLATSFTANALSSGKKLANLIFSLFSWPFKNLLNRGDSANQCELGYNFSKWINLLFLIVIAVITYLWRRQYRINKTLEEINKEIDLQ